MLNGANKQRELETVGFRNSTRCKNQVYQPHFICINKKCVYERNLANQEFSHSGAIDVICLSFFGFYHCYRANGFTAAHDFVKILK